MPLQQTPQVRGSGRKTASKARAESAAAATAAATAAPASSPSGTEMTESERADTCSTLSDAPAVEKVSDDHASASRIYAVPVDTDLLIAMAFDQSAASDNRSEYSRISAAVVTVHVGHMENDPHDYHVQISPTKRLIGSR